MSRTAHDMIQAYVRAMEAGRDGLDDLVASSRRTRPTPSRSATVAAPSTPVATRSAPTSSSPCPQRRTTSLSKSPTCGSTHQRPKSNGTATPLRSWHRRSGATTTRSTMASSSASAPNCCDTQSCATSTNRTNRDEDAPLADPLAFAPPNGPAPNRALQDSGDGAHATGSGTGRCRRSGTPCGLALTGCRFASVSAGSPRRSRARRRSRACVHR